MSAPISLGIVGCGYWGPLLVPNFRALPGCELKAVGDASETRLKHVKTLYPDITCVTDYDRFFGDLGVDAIVIATPVKSHYPLAKASSPRLPAPILQILKESTRKI